MRNTFSWRLITFFCLSAFISGCQTLVNSGDDGAHIDDGTHIIDQGMVEINQNHEKWADVLQRVSRELPESVGEDVRNEARALATRSMVQADTPFQCTGDLLGKRALQGLQRIKDMVAGNANPTPLPPAVCLVTPPDVDLGADFSIWGTITVHGYDLDRADGEGNLIGFSLVNADHSVIQPIPQDLIERPTHSRITLNLRELAETLHTKNITQIVPNWTGNLDGSMSGEIVVKPWSAGTDTMKVELGKTTFIPPHVSGDPDFHTGPDDPTYGFVSAKIAVDEHTIKGHIHMNAVQQKGDKTQAEGQHDYVLWDKLPENWKIIRVDPTQSSKRPFIIKKPGENSFTQPGGQIVNRFIVYGTHKGQGADGSTRVEVDWRPLTIDIQETRPAWYKPEQQPKNVSSVDVPPSTTNSMIIEEAPPASDTVEEVETVEEGDPVMEGNQGFLIPLPDDNP